MFAGPIIAREVLTAPRPLRFYIARAAYAGLLFILMWTAWQSLVGWSEVHEVGLTARFGGLLFQIFTLIQLSLMLFFAPLAAATAVAHEKDRRTFVLLLMTDLRDVEIVLGKLLASLLQILTLLATAAPVFFLCALLGGVAPRQVVDVLGITAAAGLVGGSLGLVVALWRDRTFQSLALTVLLVVLSLAAVETVGLTAPGLSLLGVPLVEALNPFRAALAVVDATAGSGGSNPTTWSGVQPGVLFMLISLLLAVALNVLAVARLRVWNPGRNEPREQREGAEESSEGIVEIEEVEQVSVRELLAHDQAQTLTGLHVPRRTHRRLAPPPRPYREPWSNPILWRELMTRAYGTKPLIIKGAYVLIFALGAAFFAGHPMLLVFLGILSLILINAQGVTAMTSERDTGALDLLLATELSPREFIYGKLYGALYNTKEMVALPVLLTLWYAVTGALTVESAVYIIVDFLLLAHFAAMLGLHAAITYTNSRTAVANSLGTIFFLMVGILVCAYLIILSDQEFGRQLLSFMIFIGAGSVALFGSLGAKNPSRAIALVSILTPFWTFYCIISLIRGEVLAAFLVSVGIYGFALLAMLVPAVSDFDIALGRTSAIQG